MHCSAPRVTMPSIESSLDECKGKCRDCYSITYYAGLKTNFAKRCYVYMSEAECGTLISYNDTGGTTAWDVAAGYNNDLIRWPGNSSRVPSTYADIVIRVGALLPVPASTLWPIGASVAGALPLAVR